MGDTLYTLQFLLCVTLATFYMALTQLLASLQEHGLHHFQHAYQVTTEICYTHISMLNVTIISYVHKSQAIPVVISTKIEFTFFRVAFLFKELSDKYSNVSKSTQEQ